MKALRTYLEMTTPPSRAPSPPRDDVRIARAVDCPPSLYRALYRDVGKRWCWIDRLEWTDSEIRAHLAKAEIAVWTLTVAERLAGYFELRRADDSVEIAYLGLLPDFIGHGLGRVLLEAAIVEAWQTHPTRVWLHTSTLDHPAAIENYLKRGFRAYRREEYEIAVP